MSVERWRTCLLRPGALALKARRGGFAIHPGNDRRRRPLARLSAADAAVALAAGDLVETSDGLRIPQVMRGEAGRSRGHRPVTLESVSIPDEKGRLEPVTRNVLAHPLGRYRDQLSAAQLNAADQFLRDHAVSTLTPRITRNWSLDSGGARSLRGPEDAPLAALAAKDRVFDAFEAVGPDLARVITASLITEESLAAIERRFGWASRSGMTVLKLALDALARHYRLG